MKGVIFQKPFEFQLLVDGESWHQGDSVSGHLVIKNHGSENLPLAGIYVSIAQAMSSKVKKKDPGAFKVGETVKADEAQIIAPGAEVRVPWNFSLDRNFPITDSRGSPYLIYGHGEATEKLGQLQLTIEPNRMIGEFLNVLQVQHRFVIKQKRASKGWVEVKLEPPTAKNFAAVEFLTLDFRFDDEERMETEYTFQVQKIEASAGTVDLTHAKKDFEQVLDKTDYLLPSGRVNHDRIDSSIQEVFRELGVVS